MLVCAREFVRSYIHVDKKERAVIFPAVFKIFWSDFGGLRGRVDVLKNVIGLANPLLKQEIESLLIPVGLATSKPSASNGTGSALDTFKHLLKPKIVYEALIWNPVFIL